MRELSVIELDLIVGGYDEAPAGSFDETVYEPVATLEADGSYSVEVSEAMYQSQAQAASDDGWKIEVTGTVSNNPSLVVKASKSC